MSSHLLQGLVALFVSLGLPEACIAQTNWLTPVELPAQSIPSSVFAIQSYDQGHYVIGAASVGSVTASLAVASLDSEGATRWTYAPNQRAAHSATTPLAGATMLAVDTDSAPVIAFACPEPGGQTAHCVAKLDRLDGHELWRTQISLPGGPYYSDVAARLAVSPAGGYFLQSAAGQLSKLATDGSVIWSRPLDAGSGTRGVPAPNGDWVYVADAGVRRLAGADGVVRWSYEFATDRAVLAAGLLPRNDDNTLLHAWISNAPSPHLTDRLLKFDADGRIVWVRDDIVSEYFGPRNTPHLQVGDNILRVFMDPALRYVVSSTNDRGELVWQMQVPSDELFAVAGQLLLRTIGNWREFARIDATTGALQPPVQFPVSLVQFNVLASDRFVAFASSETFPRTETRLEAFRLDATPVWGASVFSTRPVSAALISPATRPSCPISPLTLASDGTLSVYTVFETLPRLDRPQQSEYSISSAYHLRYSAPGALLGAQNLGTIGCPPAETVDGSAFVYSFNFGVHKVRPDGSVEWSTRLPLTSSSGRTYLFADGSVLAQEGTQATRLSSTGEILSVAQLAFPQGPLAELVAAVPWGLTELLAVDPYGRVFRTNGTSVAWSLRLPSNGCDVSYARTIKLLRRDEQSVLVLFNDCEGAKLARVSESGALLWQQQLATISVAASARATAIAIDGNGQIFVAGCSYDPVSGRQEQTLVQVFRPDGTPKWKFAGDVVAQSYECPTAIAVLADGRVFVAITSDRRSHSGHLLQLTASGTFDGTSTRLLEQPPIVVDAMLPTSADRLAILGTSPLVSDATTAFLPQSLREIQPGSFARPWFIGFAPTTQTEFRYGDTMTVTLRLLDATNTPRSPTESVTVRLYPNSGAGHWVGANECQIPVGADSCTLQGRWSKVEPSFSLRAESDGVAPAYSPTFALRPARPTLTILPVSVPSSAWDLATFDVRYDAATPVESNLMRRFHVAVVGGYEGSCANLTVVTPPPFTLRCTIRSAGGTSTLYANVDNDSGEYESTTSSLIVGPIARAQPVLLLERETDAPTRLGDRVRFFVKLLLGTRDLTPQYYSGTISSGCPNPQLCSFVQAGTFSGLSRYFVDVPALNLGSFSTEVRYQGGVDLLPAIALPATYEVQAGAGVRGAINLPAYLHPRLCATSPGANCQFNDNFEYFCEVPVGWSGQIVALADGTATTGWIFKNSPVRIADASQVYRVQFTPQAMSNDYGNCLADVDGDGFVGAYTDGVIILRAMLGLRGPALNVSATHACVPFDNVLIEARATTMVQRSPFFPSLRAAADIDGNGQVDIATDGLLLLRALLGFSGPALTNGALGQGAVRNQADQIRNYVALCGASLN